MRRIVLPLSVPPTTWSSVTARATVVISSASTRMSAKVRALEPG